MIMTGLSLRLLLVINNLTRYVSGRVSHRRVLTRSSLDADDLLSLLEDFKMQIQSVRPRSIVSFVTIPTASFDNFQSCKNLASPILSADGCIQPSQTLMPFSTQLTTVYFFETSLNNMA